MTDTASPAPTSLFRHRPFLLFIASRAFSSMAFQGAGVAIGWLVYDRTRQPLDLGLIGLCQFLPMVVLTFVVGQVADLFDRRRIALICQAVEALTLLTITLGVLQGWLGLPEVFAAVTVLGAAQAFERPTMAALLPGIVPDGVLQRAIANSTSVMQTALVLGPAIGGALYGLGPVIPFAAATVSFVVAATSAALMPHPGFIPSKEPVTLSSVFAGAAFIRSRPVMLATISLDLFAVLLGGAVALMPVYARDILHAGPLGLGLLRTSPAIGAIAMSIAIGWFPLRRSVGKIMLGAVARVGAAALAFAL
jgi:MFS family permease